MSTDPRVEALAAAAETVGLKMASEWWAEVLDHLPPDWCGHTAEWLAAHDRTWQEIEQPEIATLRAVLLRYGAHDHDCPAEMPSPFTGIDQGCSCGLVQTWTALAAPEGQP